MGSERDQRANTAPDTSQIQRNAQDKTPPEVQAAPILPRKKPDGEKGKGASELETDMAKEQALEAQAAEEARAGQNAQLMEVLSTVWKASAAVVEVALGRGGAKVESGAVSGNASPTAVVSSPSRTPDTGGQDAMTVAALPPVSVLAKDSSGSQADNVVPLGHAMGEPVAYTEHGTSTWAPTEPGRLMSLRA